MIKIRAMIKIRFRQAVARVFPWLFSWKHYPYRRPTPRPGRLGARV